MTSEQFRQLRIIDMLFLPRADRKNVKHLVHFFARSVFIQETLRPTHLLGELFHLDTLCNLGGIASENQNLEPRVCGKKVLKFVRSSVCGTDENLRKYTLSDNEVLGNGLMSSIDNRRTRIVNTDATREGAKCLEFPAQKNSRNVLSYMSDDQLQELLMRNPIFVLLCLWLIRIECRKLLVEIDQVLRVLSAFEFILCRSYCSYFLTALNLTLRIMAYCLQERNIRQTSQDLSDLPD